MGLPVNDKRRTMHFVECESFNLKSTEPVCKGISVTYGCSVEHRCLQKEKKKVE